MESIDPRHLLVKIAEILEKLRIPYAITGGMAVFVWAKPRFTADIDVIVLINIQGIEELAGELARISKYSYIDKDEMIDALRNRGEFNFIDGASGVKVDFWVLSGDDFSQSQIRRRIPKEVLGKKVFFVSPEDLILNKLLWYKQGKSAKQAEDIETILEFQQKLNWKYLKEWAKRQSTLKDLESLSGKTKS